MLPNFFIVGAPKAGSTSLYNFLDQHPQVFMSPIKEPCYFASEVRTENFDDRYQRYPARQRADLKTYLQNPVREKRFGCIVSDWEDYLSLFDGAANHQAVGEASVCYLYSPTAARNIAQRIPDARIIIVLRDPAERAYSQYLHCVANGYVRRPFREHIEASLASKEEKFGPLYPFLECGMYYEQVNRYLAHFPRENILVCFYQDGHAGILAGVFRFLKLEPLNLDVSRKHLDRTASRQATALYGVLRKYGLLGGVRRWTPVAVRPALRRLAFRNRIPPAMEENDRNFLRAHYHEDIVKLAALLNRDLSSWMALEDAVPHSPARAS
jgi:hypothetical protein